MKIQVNHNKLKAEEIRCQVKLNDGYCPCRVEHTPETKCICKDFLDKVNNGYIGECHCGLYESVKE